MRRGLYLIVAPEAAGSQLFKADRLNMPLASRCWLLGGVFDLTCFMRNLLGGQDSGSGMVLERQ